MGISHGPPERAFSVEFTALACPILGMRREQTYAWMSAPRRPRGLDGPALLVVLRWPQAGVRDEGVTGSNPVVVKPGRRSSARRSRFARLAGGCCRFRAVGDPAEQTEDTLAGLVAAAQDRGEQDDDDGQEDSRIGRGKNLAKNGMKDTSHALAAQDARTSAQRPPRQRPAAIRLAGDPGSHGAHRDAGPRLASRTNSPVQLTAITCAAPPT